MTPVGLPHSEIPGSKLVCSYPRLIAAYRVLHRLLVPRHPPCALSSLTGTLRCMHAVTQHFVFGCQRSIAAQSRAAQRERCGGKDLWGQAASRLRPSLLSGGDSGARTRSLRLAKPALSQLSYIPGTWSPRWNELDLQAWWAWVDSNHPPHAYQACALTN